MRRDPQRYSDHRRDDSSSTLSGCAGSTCGCSDAARSGSSSGHGRCTKHCNTSWWCDPSHSACAASQIRLQRGLGHSAPGRQDRGVPHPDGTGGKDWNPTDNPICVRRGMVLRLIDDDKSTRSGGHCMSAPMGKISGVFEHNVANGIGQLHIEVVADAN
jgi:hypothetical protein